jgi:hypothetical protein
MLEKSHELNARLLNHHQVLDLSELIDRNYSKNEIVQFELRTNHGDNGKFLIYFQGEYH